MKYYTFYLTITFISIKIVMQLNNELKNGIMKRINFTSGTLQKLTDEHYTLHLYNGEKRVYSATISTSESAQILDKHFNKITLI